MLRIFTEIVYQTEKGNDTVLVAIAADKGSAPRGKGSLMLVSKTGRLLGTVGGGAVEFDAEKQAVRLLGTQEKGAVKEYALNRSGDIGMVCGGEVTLLFIRFSANDPAAVQLAGAVLASLNQKLPGVLAFFAPNTLPELYAPEALPAKTPLLVLPLPIGERAILFGGGHISAALCPLLTTVGFRVTVLDCREEYATRERFPQAEKIIAAPFSDIEAVLTLQSEDYAVVMTNGHAFDLDVEKQLLQKELAYVGVIGSRAKIASVNEKLRAAGICEERLAAVHTPIGTPIKAVTPEEIAVSIAGEMILERALRREREGLLPSHACPMHMR